MKHSGNAGITDANTALGVFSGSDIAASFWIDGVDVPITQIGEGENGAILMIDADGNEYQVAADEIVWITAPHNDEGNQ